MTPYNASDLIRAMESRYGLTRTETPSSSLAARFGHAISTLLRRTERK